MTDRLSSLYQDLLSGSYDCVDRIVLNAYFRMGHSPGGFRVWWRALTGSDETLENAYLMRMAGRFSRRVRGYAKAHGIPGQVAMEQVMACGLGPCYVCVRTFEVDGKKDLRRVCIEGPVFDLQEAVGW